jgi:hypothetical protein
MARSTARWRLRQPRGEKSKPLFVYRRALPDRGISAVFPTRRE